MQTQIVTNIYYCTSRKGHILRVNNKTSAFYLYKECAQDSKLVQATSCNAANSYLKTSFVIGDWAFIPITLKCSRIFSQG